MRSLFLNGSAMVMAATMGVGIFALPYVVQQSGWGTSLFYLLILTAVVIQSHYWYWQVLSRAEGQRLLGLVWRLGGRGLFLLAFCAVVIGLLLVLLAYLVLAGAFFSLLFPTHDKLVGTLIVWALGSLPLILGVRRLVHLESLGVGAMLVILLGFFSLAMFSGRSLLPHPFMTEEFFLPFGPLLFALAGWTALEPTYDSETQKGRRSGFRGVAWGTILSAFFYAVFVLSVFLLAPEISEDTASGLVAWPAWQRSLLSLLGLVLIVKSFVPVAWEIHTSLHRDLHINSASFLVPVVVPLGLLLLGFNNFLGAIHLAGGLFLSLQYLCILFVAWKLLSWTTREKIIAGLTAMIFSLAALYEAFAFLLY